MSDERRKVDIDVSVDSTQMENLIKRLDKTEKELENEKTLREEYESKLRIIAEQKLAEKLRIARENGCPSYVSDIESLRKWEQEQSEQNQSNRGSGEVVGRGGSGSVPLDRNFRSNQKKREYASYEEMVFDINERARDGDQKAIEQKHALEKKFLNAIKSGDLPNTIYDENKLSEDKLKTEPSMIMKIIQRDNQKLRNRALERRGESVE